MRRCASTSWRRKRASWSCSATPSSRAWAHYWNAVLEGFERRSFLRAVRDEMARPGTWGIDAVYLGAGFYADAVARYLDLFGREQVQVLFYETFRAHPRGSLGDVLGWLGLDASATDQLAARATRRPAPPTLAGGASSVGRVVAASCGAAGAR